MNGAEEFPWSVLGLDPAVSTDRDVKRAYARLVKQFRPDRDPESFQRIHSAYELALVQLQQDPWNLEVQAIFADEASSDQTDSSGPQETTERPPALPSLPEDFVNAEAGARQALQIADSVRLQVFLGKLRSEVYADRSLAPAWERCLLQMFEKDFAKLAHLVRDEDIYVMIEERCETLPEAMLGFWHATGCTMQMVALADFFLQHKPSLDHPAALVLQARLSLHLAFANLAKAEQLTNAVFPLMTPEMRDWILPKLESRLAIAKVFRTLPPESRRYWEQHLCAPEEETIEWEETQLGNYYREVTERCPPDWPGYQILSSAIPKPLYNRLNLHYRPKPPKVQATTFTKETTFPKFFLHIVIALALLALKNIRSCSDSQNNSRRPDFPRVPNLRAY